MAANTTRPCTHCRVPDGKPCEYPGTLCPGRIATDDILRRLTVAIRSAAAVGLPVIAGTCEDAATEIILMRAEALKGAI